MAKRASVKRSVEDAVESPADGIFETLYRTTLPDKKALEEGARARIKRYATIDGKTQTRFKRWEEWWEESPDVRAEVLSVARRLSITPEQAYARRHDEKKAA